MGLGKPQLHAKFEIAGYIYYENIRNPFLNDKFAPRATLWGSYGSRTGFIYSALKSAYRVVDFLLAITELFAGSYG